MERSSGKGKQQKGGARGKKKDSAKGKQQKDPAKESAKREKHQKEMLHLAQDVFNYLSLQIYPTNAIPKACERSNFSEDVGKGCYFKMLFGRTTWRDILKKEYPDRPLGSREFVCWFNYVVRKHYCDEKEPFSEVLQTMALMFEAVMYALEKGHSNTYKILPFMWTDYCMQRMYPNFYEQGGWTTFRKKAKDIATTYGTFYLTSEVGAMELIAAYREDEPSTAEQGAVGGSNTSKQVAVPLYLQNSGFPPYVSEDSNLARTLRGLMGLRIRDGILKPAVQELHRRLGIPGATLKSELPGCRRQEWYTISKSDSENTPPDSPEEASPVKGKKPSLVKKKRGSTSKSVSSGSKTDPGSESVSEACSEIQGEESRKSEDARVPQDVSSQEAQGARKKTFKKKASSGKKK